MKIWTLWQDEGEGDMPWLVDSYDEYTLDNCGDVPPTYQAHKDEDPNRRELVIQIPDGAVMELFKPRKVDGAVWVSPEAAEKARIQFNEDKERGR